MSTQNMYTNSCGNVIHNSPQLETSQWSITMNGETEWYICSMENYAAIKKEKILIQTTTWIHLKNIKLNEVKDKDSKLYESI